MKDMIGKQLGRYKITSLVGEGGMATVYLAEDTTLHREVAVKMIRVGEIPPNQLPRMLERFKREAEALARLSDDPAIVTVHDYGEFDDAPYLVMAYMPGGTLKDRLGKPIDYREAAELLLPVTEALALAHEHGIVHRDVKPSNLLVDRKGNLALADFGIAKALEVDGQTLTGTGMGVGTPEYMAPEQWKGEASPQTDVYALGVVLYEMVTGQKPYSAGTPSEVFLKQMTQPPERPRDLVPGLPEAVEALLDRAMDKEPAARYPSMGAFQAALKGVLKEELAYDETPVAVAQQDEQAAPGLEATFDELATPSPLGEVPLPAAEMVLEDKKEKEESTPRLAVNRRPKWIFPVLGLVLVGAMIGVGNGLVKRGQQGNSPLANLETENSYSPAITNSPVNPTGTMMLARTPVSTSTGTTIAIPPPKVEDLTSAEFWSYVAEKGVIVEPLCSIDEIDTFYYFIDTSPLGNWIALGGIRELLIIDAHTCEVYQRFSFSVSLEKVQSAFSPNEQFFAYSTDEQVFVLDLSTLEIQSFNRGRRIFDLEFNSSNALYLVEKEGDWQTGINYHIEKFDCVNGIFTHYTMLSTKSYQIFFKLVESDLILIWDLNDRNYIFDADLNELGTVILEEVGFAICDETDYSIDAPGLIMYDLTQNGVIGVFTFPAEEKLAEVNYTATSSIKNWRIKGDGLVFISDEDDQYTLNRIDLFNDGEQDYLAVEGDYFRPSSEEVIVILRDDNKGIDVYRSLDFEKLFSWSIESGTFWSVEFLGNDSKFIYKLQESDTFVVMQLSLKP